MKTAVTPALNLEAKYYCDPDLFAAERDCIFRRSWQLIGPESAVQETGNYLATDIAGIPIFAIRGRDGALRGFQNVCRHRGSRLLESGLGRCETVRCPYHRWTYNDKGHLIETPWFDEPTPFDLTRWPLESVALEVWRGLIFVAVAPQERLEEQLGDFPDETLSVPLESFVASGTEVLTAEINWKTYLDQFLEYYHTPSVHVPDKRVGIEKYVVEPRRRMMRMIAPPDSSYFGGKWLWGWPNWTLSIFPGGMKTSRINPVGTSRIEVHFSYYFADSPVNTSEARTRVITATSSIFAEDIRACDRVQSNYESGAYRPGPFHPQHEVAVAYFHDLVRQALPCT